MGRLIPLVFLALSFVTAACSNTKAADSTPSWHVNLKQPPSQPLTDQEYANFKQFVQTQDNVTRFAPQKYIFTQADESNLTMDQKSLLTSVRSNICTVADKPQHTGDQSNIQPGAKMSNSDERTISGQNNSCPINYNSNMSQDMVVQSIDENAKTFSMSGNFTFSSSLQGMTPYAQNILGASTIDQGNGTMSMAVSQGNAVIQASINGESHVSPYTAGLYNVKNQAEVYMEAEQGGAHIEIALNADVFTGAAKDVVISLRAAIDGGQNAGGLKKLEFFVNGTPVADADRQQLLQSHFVQSILTGTMSEIPQSSLQQDGLKAVSSLSNRF